MKSGSIVRFAGVLACAGVLHVSASGATESMLYSFCSQPQCADGALPTAGLINVDGTLYGTTSAGGSGGCCNNGDGFGVVFSFNRKTDVEKTVYTFQGTNDGYGPDASLINVNGTLYGTAGGAHAGGASAYGVIYSVNPSDGAEQVVYSFQGGSDGQAPYAGLINVNGILYGTTTEGGACTYCGTVFSFNPTTRVEKVVYSFGSKALDGTYPLAGLIKVGGLLYGTTLSGGGGDPANCNEASCGAVFSVNPKTGVEKVLYSFQGNANCGSPNGICDGYNPVAGLLNYGGTLYGTTPAGGKCPGSGNGCGTIFSVNPKSGAEQVVYSFQGGSDGLNPQSDLIDVSGTLYGTTFWAGIGCGDSTPGCGTVYSFDPTTGLKAVVHPFSGGKSDGANPSAGLIYVGGKLYGTTGQGGGTGCYGGGCGTVFSVTP